MIKDIEARLRAGEDVPDCLAKTMIEHCDNGELDHLDMAMLASVIMIGGVETVCMSSWMSVINYSQNDGKTASIIQWFSALIPAHPKVQKKAKEELDRVIGRDRLPTVEDEKNLPYCHVSVFIYQICYRSKFLSRQLSKKSSVCIIRSGLVHHIFLQTTSYTMDSTYQRTRCSC